MSNTSGHGGARAGAGRKRKADNQISSEDTGDRPGPGRPRKSLPRGGLMSGTGVLHISIVHFLNINFYML